ncbi:putative bel12 ag transposon polyprotein, partial [Operophtera brumata]
MANLESLVLTSSASSDHIGSNSVQCRHLGQGRLKQDWALTKEAPDLLRNLIDTILKNLRALKLLGEPVDSWDTLIIYIIVTKLDKTTEREWEQYKTTNLKQSGDSKSIMKVEVLLAFLKDRADMLETLFASHASTSNKKPSTNTQNNYKMHCNVSTNNPPGQTKRLCSLCAKPYHPPYACQRFLNSNLEAKLKLIKEHSLCENCLRAGHNVDDCRYGPCRKCDHKHNSLIHRDIEVNANVTPRSSSENDKPVLATALTMHSSLPAPPPAESSCSELTSGTIGAHTDVLCANYPCVQPVLLSTALVEVMDGHNNYHLARALLDSGSERCIITQSLCDILGIQLIQSTQEIRGVGCFPLRKWIFNFECDDELATKMFNGVKSLNLDES